jgi:pyridine nucleotide-disulfide oxidoreductase family protein
MGAVKRLLLVGAGHAHAQVLRDWARRPVAGTELVVVSPDALAPYSGMVPGWLAGTYRYPQICIDFAALAAAAGARLRTDTLGALDPQRRRVRLASGAELDYDLLSLNVGSTLEPPRLQGPHGLALRPLGRLHAAWEALLPRLQARRDGRPLRVTAVGGGAAGFESLLAVLARLRALQPGRPVQGRLVGDSAALLPGLAAGAAQAARRALAQARVELRLGTAWDAMQTDDSDLVLWATGAIAQAWQRDPARRGGLAVSEPGFIRVDAHLRSLSHAQVFAAGDCAEWSMPLPKAGVYAVRMGPVLLHNLRAALTGGVAAAYVPQRQFLALLATADGRAIGARGRWAAEGRWLWHWKQHIDHGFLRRFDVPAPSAAGEHGRWRVDR